MSCTCDYSYTCPECQVKIDVANQERYLEELTEWIVGSLQALAERAEVKLEDPPQKPGRYL